MNKADKFWDVFLRWRTSNEADYLRLKNGDEVQEACAWYGIYPFGSIAGLVSVAVGKYPNKAFMYPGHYAQKRF